MPTTTKFLRPRHHESQRPAFCSSAFATGCQRTASSRNSDELTHLHISTKVQVAVSAILSWSAIKAFLAGVNKACAVLK